MFESEHICSYYNKFIKCFVEIVDVLNELNRIYSIIGNKSICKFKSKMLR